MADSKRVTTYDPKQVTCALGSHIVSGWADDSFITIEPVGDGISYVQGCDGEIARSVDPSTMYTVKLSVLQASATNAYLNKQLEKDRTNGTGTFPITVKDILGSEKFYGSVAWVSKAASWQRGKAQNNREWEITVGHGKFTI